MERKIENYIDRSLESIAPILYMSGVTLGTVLIIIGIIVISKNKTAPSDKKKVIGVTSICIGFLALFSGITQSLL